MNEHPAPDLDLDIQRHTLRAALSGAPASVPLLWAVTLLVLWPLGRLGLPPAGWLLGAMGLASGLWRLSFLRRRPDLLDPSPAGLRRAEREIEANAALSGLVWSGATVLLYPALQGSEAVLHVAALAGSVAMAAFYMSQVGRSFVLLAWPTLLTLAAVSAWVRQPEVAVGSLLFLGGMQRAAIDHRDTHRRAIRLGLETRQANEALARAMASMASETAAKARLLATLGHEIRTPLNGLNGALELLAGEPLSPGQQQWLQAARAAQRRLIGTLRAVRDHLSLATGQWQAAPRPLVLQTFCEDLLRQHAEAARRKGLLLAFQTSPGLPEQVLADPDWLKQLLDQVLGNAVKFTERGQVLLHLRAAPDQPGLIRFEVSDTGCGIPAQDLPQLFQPFMQLDSGPRRAQGGNGLGLVIARGLARQMGGDIRVESQAGQGSVFSVSLPLPTCEASGTAPSTPPVPSPATAAPRLQGTVLVAEDDPLNRLVAVQMLERSGLTVLQAEDGEQALAALQRGGVSLVLMDGQMPALDGYAATRQWREREARLGSPRLPIIALSANTAPADLQLAHDSGMDAHLPKPYRPQDLIGLLARWLPAAA